MASISPDARWEISRLLRMREDFIGTVYALNDDGYTVEEIATEIGHKNTSSTKNFLDAISYLLGDADPQRSKALEQAKYRAKEWLKYYESGEQALSTETVKHLETILATTLQGTTAPKLPASQKKTVLNDLMGKASRTVSTKNSAMEALLSRAQASTSDLDTQHTSVDTQDTAGTVTGVYVYSYPMYVSTNGHECLLKVGASTVDVYQRVADQQRNTEVPEDLVLLRIYPVSSAQALAVEEKFHKLLSAFGAHASSTTGGTEWFRTSLSALDTIADVLDIPVVDPRK
jgi:hypothetical protein